MVYRYELFESNGNDKLDGCVIVDVIKECNNFIGVLG